MRASLCAAVGLALSALAGVAVADPLQAVRGYVRGEVGDFQKLDDSDPENAHLLDASIDDLNRSLR